MFCLSVLFLLPFTDPVRVVWTHTTLPNGMKSTAFRLIHCSCLTVCCLTHDRKAAALTVIVASVVTALPKSVTACLPIPAIFDFHSYLIQLPNGKVNQYLHSLAPFTGTILPISVFSSTLRLELLKETSSKTSLKQNCLSFYLHF